MPVDRIPKLKIDEKFHSATSISNWRKLVNTPIIKISGYFEFNEHFTRSDILEYDQLIGRICPPVEYSLCRNSQLQLDDIKQFSNIRITEMSTRFFHESVKICDYVTALESNNQTPVFDIEKCSQLIDLHDLKLLFRFPIRNLNTVKVNLN